MNRQIKFRVWDVEQNKFLSSYADKGIEFYHEQGKDWHEKQVRDIVPVSWFLQDHNNNLENYIVTQYTGLTDKNGKEIYEGDIVKDTWRENRPYSYSPDEEYDCEKIFEVKYEDYSFNLDRKYSREQTCVDGFHREVIGNIFEHSELLK